MHKEAKTPAIRRGFVIAMGVGIVLALFAIRRAVLYQGEAMVLFEITATGVAIVLFAVAFKVAHKQEQANQGNHKA